MQPRFRVLAVSLAAALTLVTVGCGTEGGDDAVDTKGKTTTTVAGKTTKTAVDDEPVDTTLPDEGTDPFTPSDGGAAGPYVEAMKRSMQASNEEDGDFVLTDGQIDCMAPRFIGIIGVDRLKENGVTPADIENDKAMDFSDFGMTEKDGNDLYDSFGACDINLREMMLTSMAADEDMTPEMQKCMEDVFTDENLRRFMVSSMVEGDAAMENDPLMAQLMGCAFMGMDEGMAESPSAAPAN